MTAVEEPPKPRQRGSVRRMRDRFQGRVSPGEDPSIGERIIRTADGMLLKDTKSHQMRRVSIDAPTVDLLRAHREDFAARLALLGAELTDRTWVSSASPDISRPRDPASLTRRYGRLVAKLGIDTTLKELRQYSATELLTAGVDVRTVTGWLGHGDGTTPLRHYAAWVGTADQAAAELIGTRSPVDLAALRRRRS